mmetsp:Transcript_1298/g.1976  ORF Transcript_1298/g.1976 Transcript_1298/m.1976 type:complete len:626 (+) Transcript_1298:98-1975(+)
MATASPASALDAVSTALRGSRKMRLDSKIKRSSNGLEDIDEFFSTAATPSNSGRGKKKVGRKRTSNRLEKKKNVQNRKKRSAPPRFSIAGNAQGDEVTGIKEFAQKLKKGVISPGELSHVATAPPTPKEPTLKEKSPKHQEDLTPVKNQQQNSAEEAVTPEEPRAAAPDEEKRAVVTQIQNTSSERVSTSMLSPSDAVEDFPIDDSDEDLMPPPPPPEEFSPMAMDDPIDSSEKENFEVSDFTHPMNTPENAHSAGSKNKKKSSSRRKSKEIDEVLDENDNDGPGFQMPSPTEATTQESISTKTTASIDPKEAILENKRKKVKTPTTRRNQKKQKQVTMFSPPGYPISNREMQPIPVSDYMESPEEGEDNLRRSRRMKVKPLAYWKNERVVYGPHEEDGELGEEMGHMPVPKSLLTALPTPRRHRKQVELKQSWKQIAGKANLVEEEKEFNSTKLRKKFSINNGETAQMWDEGIEDSVEQKVISYVSNLVSTDLPRPASRRKSEGKVVGRAAQSFNIQSGENDVTVGYIMGNLTLPPKGIKDPETTGSCSQVFTVCHCQPKSLEIAYADPHEEEGSLNPETAQRFLLSAGDQFRVPPGNAYKLVNHSTTTDSFLAWTIIRPRVDT